MQQRLLALDQNAQLAISFRPSPRPSRQLRYARRPVSGLEGGAIFPVPVSASVRCTAAAEAVEAATDGEARAEAKLTFQVKNLCQLDVESDLDGSASSGSAALVALYHYYRYRSLRLSAAVLDLLEKHPELRDTIVASGNDVDFVEQLGERPEDAAAVLDSLRDLMFLAKVGAPVAAAEVEAQIRAEMDKERAKAPVAGTDTPVAVLAATTGDAWAAAQGGGPSAAAAPLSLAAKLLRGPHWEHWKFRLRSALIDASAAPGAALPAPKSRYSVRFLVDSRTADDVSMLVELRLSASGPGVGSLATQGPDGADPTLRTFFLFEFMEQPEATMLEALRSACWKAAQMPLPPDSFTCALPSAAEGPAEFEGSGEELRVVMMALAALEGGEFIGGKKAAHAFVPATGRVQVRRRRRGGYQLRVAADEGEDWETHTLTQREVLALLECLDAFSELQPGFGLGEPRLEVPRTPVLRRATAAIKGLVGQ